MPEPLTLNELKNELGVFEKRFDKRLDDMEEILTSAKETLDGVAEKVDRIDKNLWEGERLNEHERRIIGLAETVGRPDLAPPFSGSIGN